MLLTPHEMCDFSLPNKQGCSSGSKLGAPNSVLFPHRLLGDGIRPLMLRSQPLLPSPLQISVMACSTFPCVSEPVAKNWGSQSVSPEWFTGLRQNIYCFSMEDITKDTDKERCTGQGMWDGGGSFPVLPR